MLRDFFKYLQNNMDQILKYTLEHIELTFLAVTIAALLGIPIGIIITKSKKIANGTLGVTGVIQAIPSLALLGFLIPAIGIGVKPAVIMVILYSLLPIVKNTYVGLSSIDPSLIEASRGMGMTDRQILFKVKIPIAYPLIMAGLRISVVSAVGLMTIAAFIGAGGLGYLVFSGVQMVDNNLILAGAIPACLLALLMDFIVGKIENIFTPYGIRMATKSDKLPTIKQVNRQRKVVFSAFSAVLIVIVSILTINTIKNRNTIVVGSKQFTENIILAHMMEQMIENDTDLNVVLKDRLGGTNIVHQAILNGEVDVYPDYTGTSYTAVMKQKVTPDCDSTCVYENVKDYYKEEFDIDYLESFGFNNTYTLAVKKEIQERYNIKTYSDLANISNELVLGSTIEFLNRPDGYIGLEELYNLNFKDTVSLNDGIRYTALSNDEVNVIDAFSTDGLLVRYDLYVLEDDLNFFPPYYGAALIRGEVVRQHPEVKIALEKLSGLINDETMARLNYLVDVEKQDPKEVATNFLKDQGLLE